MENNNMPKGYFSSKLDKKLKICYNRNKGLKKGVKMIDFSNVRSYNLENAIRGMRYPYQSWDRADSSQSIENGQWVFEIGEEDLKLAQKLIKAGTDHSKFMRQIFISMDITAPLYYWKEMDQYKVATTTNSESTMLTLSKKEITRDQFSFDKNLSNLLIEDDLLVDDVISTLLTQLENLRKLYVETGNKKYWRALIQLLPSSWNQTRLWTGNYAILRNIYFSRRYHRLSEWKEFCNLIESLPYGKELICYTGEDNE